MRKTVAIIIVVTNEESHLPVLLKSITNQSYKNIQVYILDNNCVDNSMEIIHALYPAAKIIHSQINTGFAKGNNILADAAIKEGADYIFVLNPDIELHIDCISRLVNLMERHRDISIAAPIMFFGLEKRNENVIQSYIKNIDFKKRKIEKTNSGKVFVDGMYPEEVEVNIVPGGITFIESEVINQIGLFEEMYFMYGDESDLALRAYKKGYKMMITSAAKVWHHHDFSKKNRNGCYFKYYYITRARYLYFRKYKFYKSLLTNLIKEIITSPFKVKWAIKICDIRLLNYYYKGIWDGLMNKKGESKLIKNISNSE